MTPQYQIKQPAIVDFYSGEYPVAWQSVYRAIFKASEYVEDSKVEQYVLEAKANNQLYGLYHFLVPNNISQQADLFLSVIHKVGQGNMPVTVDIEIYPATYGVSQLTWRSQIKSFLDTLEASLGYKPMIYTSKNYWNYTLDSNGNPAGWEDAYPLWVAQYPLASTVDATPAPTLIPKGWSTWAMWQYSADGRTQGYFANDYSTINGWYKNYLDSNWAGTTVPDIITSPYEGMQRISGKRNSWKFEMFKLDITKYKFEVVYCNPPETVPSVVARKGALLGFNAGDYNRFTYEIQDYTVSNGKEIKSRVIGGGRPSLMFDTNNNFAIDINNISNVNQAFTGIRSLIQNGIIDPKLYDITQNQNVEGHARFSFGIDDFGNLVLVASEGIHPKLTVFNGLTLSELAELEKEYGAKTSADGGGGGDVSCIFEGHSLITPENIDSNGNSFFRALPVVFLVYNKKKSVFPSEIWLPSKNISENKKKYIL